MNITSIQAFFGRDAGLPSAPAAPEATRCDRGAHAGQASAMETGSISFSGPPEGSIAAVAAMRWRAEQQQTAAQRKPASSSHAAPSGAAAGGPGMLPTATVTSLYGNLRASMLDSAAQRRASASATSVAAAWSFANSQAAGGAAGASSGSIIIGGTLPPVPASSRATSAAGDWVASATDSSAALAAAAAAAATYSNNHAGSSHNTLNRPNDSIAAAAAGGASMLDMPNAELLSSLLAGASLHSSSSPGNRSCPSSAFAGPAALPGFRQYGGLCSAPGGESSSARLCMPGTLMMAANCPGQLLDQMSDTPQLLDQRSNLLQQLQQLQAGSQLPYCPAAGGSAQPALGSFDGYASPAAGLISNNPDRSSSNLLTALQQLQALTAAEAIGSGSLGGLLLLDQGIPADQQCLQAFMQQVAAAAAAQPGFTASDTYNLPGLQAYLQQPISHSNHTPATATAATGPQQCKAWLPLRQPGFAAAPDAAALQQTALPRVTPGAGAALTPGHALLASGPGSSGASSSSGSTMTCDQRQGSASAEAHHPTGHGAHNPLYKTELCRSWLDNGSCRYGGRCQFAHGAAELRVLVRHPKYRTQPCRTFGLTGKCAYGDRCTFLHELLPGLQLAAAGSCGDGSSRASSFSGAGRTSSTGIDASVVVVPAAAGHASGKGE